MRSTLLIATLATLAAGCSGGDDTGKTTSSVDIADYNLRLNIITPGNQDPFDGLTQLDLVIEPSAGDALVYTLSSAASGETPLLEDLPELDEATIALRGYNGNDLVAFGRTDAISLQTGEDEVDVLVSLTNAFAELSALPEALYGAAAAPDGTGRFYVFGGRDKGFSGSTSACTDAIYALDIAPPQDLLSFTSAGTMPTAEDSESACRVAATATLLTGPHALKGKILVAGGGIRDVAGGGVTGTAFLFDPATDELELLDSIDDMVAARFHHTAVEDSAGHVVIAGGYGEASGAGFRQLSSAEYFDPSDGKFARVSGTPTGPLSWGGAARLGTDGVLICGGVEFVSGEFKWAASDACDLITTAGEFEAADTLYKPVAYPAMAALPSGGVLLTGGLDAGDDPRDYADSEGYSVEDATEATTSAYIFESGAWRPTASMNIARAMHRMAALPDGRVLIVGGVAGDTYSPWPEGLSALACAEIFDPVAETFTMVDDCDVDSVNASLPSRMSSPAIAADENYGVLVAGGLGTDDGALDSATLYVGCPDDGC